MSAFLLRLVARRVGLALLSLLLVSAMVFAITAVLPGDAATEQLGQDATPEAVAALREQLGLGQSVPVRYAHWLGRLVQGDFGRSMVSDATVSELLSSRLPNSLRLAAVTAAISIPLALVLGILAAVRRGSWFDRAVSMGTVAIVSVPEFLVATIAVLVFAVHLRWLPALSYASDISSLGQMLRAFAMPVLTLCCVTVAQMLRMTRAALIDQLEAPYIEMVRLKGATGARLVLAHALPNAIGPIANAVALSMSYLLGGVIVVETIFNYPGVSKLMVDGVAQRDIPLVQACTMIFCAGYLVLVMLADLCGILANPRLRHRR
ncbi:ABC transporter permease [Frateuria defendens]|uniref:ABC transporter permease n=1 Tax=Frateuria defendens TaxID=2219559 RepID=UPI00066FC1A7|nr:ABC transporter permease [Frateuria defendens]